MKSKLYSLKATALLQSKIKCYENIKGSYPSSNLLGKGLHEVVDAMLGHYRGVEDKLFVAVICILNVETIRHQRVPVVQGVEL